MKRYHAFYKTGGSYWYKTLAGATGAVVRAGGGVVAVIDDDIKNVERITITVEGIQEHIARQIFTED